MVDRLSSMDVSFLYLEEPTTPMHVGGVAVFRTPAGGFDHDDLVALISARIALVPRYRQELQQVPGGMVAPVWVDDDDFDITYHVRRSALPKPGNDEQLDDLVARIMSRPLDRSKPLWEIYLVEGLSGGRFAILTKTHHAMVDGISAIDIGQVILDVTEEPREVPADDWVPRRRPSTPTLLSDAAFEIARRPTALLESIGRGVSDVGRALQHAGAMAMAARSATRAAPATPWNVAISGNRRYARLDTELDSYKRIRKTHGGTVNDVILAVVAGGVRAWLQTRGEPVTARTSVRAMVPVSVRAADDDSAGNRIAPVFIDLPIGEPNPVLRLNAISFAMTGQKETGRAVGAERLVGLAGFAPSTIHSLGARAVSGLSKRVYNLLVTNVPGPQFPLFAAGAPMLAAYPVVPLAKGQGLGIGCTSYNGGVFFGLVGDREAMPDLEVLAECMSDALTELVATL